MDRQTENSKMEICLRYIHMTENKHKLVQSFTLNFCTLLFCQVALTTWEEKPEGKSELFM